MKRLLLALLLALCAGLATAETLAERYWRIHRERNATTRYGSPPHGGTNAVDQAGGDLVLVCDGFVDNTYGYTIGPLTGSYRFTVPFTTDQGWTGYALEGTPPPANMGDLAGLPLVICDPATGGNLVMLWGPDLHEHARIVGIDTAAPEIYPFDESHSGAVALVRESPAPTASVALLPEDQRRFLAPVPTGLPPELAGGDLWYDCLAIPEGNWLCECPIAGTTNTAWRGALCSSNILRAVVWRHAVGLAPTNLPVTLEHDPSRVIGRIERLFYEAGTGVVARISVTQAGYAWAVAHHSAHPSPDVRAMYATNCLVSTNGWVHEHQDYIDARCVPRGEDMTSVTNVPSGVRALVMAPVYLRGLSLVSVPLLPTYIEQPVPAHLRDVYPIRPPRQWTWRNGD